MSGFGRLLGAELRLQMRQASEWAVLVLFFLLVLLLLPFVIGPDQDLLRRLAPGLIWIAALLLVLLSLERLFVRDAADGTLDLMLISPLPLPLAVGAKLLAHLLPLLGALLVMLVPAAMMFDLSRDVLPVLALSLLLGVPVLLLLGAVMAALTLAAARGAALLTLLLTPFYIPVLIFAVAACDAAAQNMSAVSPLALLAAMLAVMIPAAPFLCAILLKQARD